MLLRLRLLGDFEQCPEFLLRRRQRRHFRRYAAVGQVFENSFRMCALLSRLFDEVFAETLEVSDIAPHGQREIRVRGGEFQVTLTVEFFNHLLRNLGFSHDDCNYKARERKRQHKIVAASPVTCR